MRINEIINEYRVTYNMGRERVYDDWTGNVVADATVRSLDPEALRAARAVFLRGHDGADRDVDDETFLNMAGLTKRGRLTNAAMILLGKATENVLPPTVCIRWRLIDTDGVQTDTRVFRGPVMLTVRQAVSMVRNSTWRTGTGDDVRQVSAYRVATLMEAVFNAVVHQDFSLGGTVDMIEREYESVTVVSRGGFPDIRPESLAAGRQDVPERRNPFLAKAASGLRMVAGNGTGIRGMYLSQLYNRMPMPEFVITEDTVALTFRGIRRGSYCRLLDIRDDIDMEAALDLDRIDRGMFVPQARIDVLERRGLVKTEDGMVFLRAGPGPVRPLPRGTDREAVAEMIGSEGSVCRSDVAAMLRARDSRGLTDRQLSVKATNLLQSMCREGTIVLAEGSTKSARYRFPDGPEK